MIASNPSYAGALPGVVRFKSATLALFAAAIFVGAALVFLVQPMVAKMVLPYFGGSPAVWLVALVFFQSVLLLGYSFAHVSMRLLSVRRQALVQLAVMVVPFAFLPMAVSADAAPPDGAAPAAWLLGVLFLTAGLPFFVVTTASPVLQRWFSTTGDTAAADPYFLYAASNAGSLLGLLAYPVLIEPRFGLADQAKLWAAGYLVFVVLAAVCAARVLAAPAHEMVARTRAVAASLGWGLRARWVAMAALPSSLMLGTSSYLSTDIASVPLLWVIPLAVYLLSFVVAFARNAPLSLGFLSRATVVTTALVLATMLRLAPFPTWSVVGIHALNLFFVALLVHRRLALERPPAERLTEFYLLLSIGGVCGGAFNALLAPLAFPIILEYPLVLALALLLRPGGREIAAGAGVLRRRADVLLPCAFLVALLGAIGVAAALGPTAVRIGLGLGLVCAVALAARPVRFAGVVAVVLALATLGQYGGLHTERTFFGVLRVVEPEAGEHVLVHGTTIHGVQRFGDGQESEPLSYYTRRGPIGQVFAAHEPNHVGVIGLGAGSIASYGRRGDDFTFYEIDRAVADVASNPRFFTFLSAAKADVHVVIGDGRLELAEAPDQSFDLIVLDAFSSDAVPIHLLTREAVTLYLAKLRPDGVMAFHVTNRHFNLPPVVAGVAASLELAARVQSYTPSEAERRAGARRSTWVMLGRDERALGSLRNDPRWRPVEGRKLVWTDQFSNVLRVTRWAG